MEEGEGRMNEHTAFAVIMVAFFIFMAVVAVFGGE